MQALNISLPTVHLGGTAREDLTERYVAATEAVAAAIEALKKTAPHARDYQSRDYTGEHGFHKANAEHVARYERLRAVRRELLALAFHTSG